MGFFKKRNTFSISGKNNHVYLVKTNGDKVEVHSPISGLDITIQGNNNELIFKEPLYFSYSSYFVLSNGSKISFGAHHPFGVTCHIGIRYGNNQTLVFGDNVSINNSYFNLGETGTKLVFGTDCMISCDCHFFSTDSHQILYNGERKNIQHKVGGIYGNHIWFGAKSMYLKMLH